ncbi:MAG: uracil-xanthine permease family protein [Mycoplasmatales bacterium]
MKFKYDVEEKPKTRWEFFVLSLQHVFAMFGSTILVPTLIGIDVGVAIFCAGLGTIIYSICTKAKVPVFIGSSFAYIPISTVAFQEQGVSGVSFIVISVGIIYILISLITRGIGTKWIDYILPPVVMGPLIIVIGLSLAPTALQYAGIVAPVDGAAFDYKAVFVSFVTLGTALFALEKGNNFLKSIPILLAIFVGYVTSIFLGMVDFSQFENLTFFSLPNFSFGPLQKEFQFDSALLLAVMPLIIVTISEHIGDHSVSSSITGRKFLKDPGLKSTLLGDGLATFCAGFLGGPVNTTYAENTGVIILTRVASVAVIRGAALIAMIISFFSPLVVFINSIPKPVMGGISMILFGLIAQNGIRIMIESKIKFNYTRNMIIVAVILVIGLGGGYFAFSIGSVEFVLTGMSLAAAVGILVHLILPDKHYSLEDVEEIIPIQEEQE